MNNIENCTSEELVAEIIRRMGDDPSRTGLKDTPARVVSTWSDLYAGYDVHNKPKITTFPNGEDGIVYNEMIIDTGTFYSNCEHHMLPFFGEYTFGYIPSKNGNVLGLSKVARVVKYRSAKLQIQERLTGEIVQMLWKALSVNSKEGPKGMALVLTGTHLCKSARGVEQEGKMTTIELRGLFKKNQATRAEFFQIMRR